MPILTAPTFTDTSITYTPTSASLLLTWNYSSNENLDYYRVTCSPEPQSGSGLVNVNSSEILLLLFWD